MAAYRAAYDSPAEAPYLPDAPEMAGVELFVLQPERALAWTSADFEGSQRRWPGPREP
jgi:hypothetical protein